MLIKVHNIQDFIMNLKYFLIIALSIFCTACATNTPQEAQLSPSPITSPTELQLTTTTPPITQTPRITSKPSTSTLPKKTQSVSPTKTQSPATQNNQTSQSSNNTQTSNTNNNTSNPTQTVKATTNKTPTPTPTVTYSPTPTATQTAQTNGTIKVSTTSVTQTVSRSQISGGYIALTGFTMTSEGATQFNILNISSEKAVTTNGTSGGGIQPGASIGIQMHLHAYRASNGTFTETQQIYYTKDGSTNLPGPTVTYTVTLTD